MDKQQKKQLIAAIKADDFALAAELLEDELHAVRMQRRLDLELSRPEPWFARAKRAVPAPSANELKRPHPGATPAASWRFGLNWANKW